MERLKDETFKQLKMVGAKFLVEVAGLKQMNAVI